MRTAYAHGAPSMFACSGHGYRSPYVVLKVTDENLPMLQYLGKVLSNIGVVTSFEDHHEFGKNVLFNRMSKYGNSCDWLDMASNVLEHPEQYDASNPSIYYHETMTSSYVPLGYRIKKKLLEELKKQEQKNQSEEQTRFRR